MSIVMLRHAQSHGNSNDFLDPGYHSELTEHGIDVATTLRYKFHQDSIVISSPIIRAFQTASIIYPNKNIFISSALSEIDFGDFKFNNKNNFNHSVFINKKFPNGESYTDLLSRLHFLLNELELHGSKNFILVTHGGVICAFLQWYYNKLDDKFPLFKVDYCGYLVIENSHLKEINGIKDFN